ncbi:hypothetical protein NTCA1_55850 [Novosphingobium sp. TCA1]|nr:hypothetical protein NTCA1_55850 [Novosphingobium sp. TCA1]
MDLGNDVNDPSNASQRYAWIELSDCIIARGDRYSVRYDGSDEFILDRLTKFADLLE